MSEPQDKDPAGKEKRPLVEAFERAWSQALFAVSTAEDEATKAAQWVAGRAGWGQEEIRRQARILTERLAQQRRELEHNVEEAVQRSLAKVKVPRREAVQDLIARLDRVEQRIHDLEERERQP